MNGGQVYDASTIYDNESNTGVKGHLNDPHAIFSLCKKPEISLISDCNK